MLQEIAFNIQQTEALTKNLSPNNAMDCNSFAASMGNLSNYDPHDTLRRNQQLRMQENQYQRSFVEQVRIFVHVKFSACVQYFLFTGME